MITEQKKGKIIQLKKNQPRSNGLYSSSMYVYKQSKAAFIKDKTK